MHRTDAVRRTAPAFLGALLGLLLVTATGTPAQAHADLIGTAPRAGADLAVLPDAVTLWFTEPVGRPAAVSVTGPEGNQLTTAGPQIAGDKVTQPIGSAPAAPGEYTVSYRMISDDGHPVSGTMRFTVGTGVETAAAGSAAVRPEDQQLDPGLLAVLGGGLLVLLGLVAFGVARRARGEQHA